MRTTTLSPADLLARIDELLELRYRSADLGNLDDPLAETVYILLSKQTREAVYMRVCSPRCGKRTRDGWTYLRRGRSGSSACFSRLVSSASGRSS